MLKWSPEPFSLEETEAKSPVVSAESFQMTGAAVVEDMDPGAGPHEFRRESGFTDSKSLMNSLTQEERSQVYELVKLDLASEYEIREKELIAKLETSLNEAQAESRASFDTWTQMIAETVAVDLKEAAAASARLAVQLAEKIIRQSAAVDTSMLVKAIETTLFKIAETSSLNIHANPDDAAWLQEQPDLLERLNIGLVVADRRVEAGGCVIQCEGREWDATLTRQLDTLNELVNEMIATTEASGAALCDAASLPDSLEPTNETEVDDVPGVE